MPSGPNATSTDFSMITIDALRISVGQETLLDGVTMHLTANAVHGIMGDGRGTLLRAVYGLLTPQSGSITAAGHPLQRHDMAYLEADPQFLPGLTARDCIDLVRRYNPDADPAPLLRSFAVSSDAEAAALPPPERKRLALVLVLMRRKRVLLLDEPFRGLDTEARFALQRQILLLGTEGRTLLVASESIAPLDGICDDLYVLGGGGVRGRYEHYELSRAARETALPEK